MPQAGMVIPRRNSFELNFANPQILYNTEGIYNVTLTATNNYGSKRLVQTHIFPLAKPGAQSVMH